MKKQNVEVEGGELLIQSKEGHYAVIPAKHRQEVMDMIKDGCDDCINNYIQTLPKDSDYAEDGSLLPDWDKVKPTDPPNKVKPTDPPPGKFTDPLNNSLSNWNKVKTALNPKNWGVTDYTDKGDFNTAYSSARKAGEKEFMWNNQRFDTKYDGTSEQQLKETGITDDQIQGRNIIRDNLHKNIRPVGYDIDGSIDAIFGKKDPRREALERIRNNEDLHEDLTEETVKGFENVDRRYDALNLYSGKPQKNNTFRISKYRPSKSEDDSVIYYEATNDKLQEFILSQLDKNGNLNNRPVIDYDLKSHLGDTKDKIIRGDDSGIMGRFTISKGEDEKGKYLSYYDKWDLSPFQNAGIDKTINFGKPFEIYDRIYYRENPKYITYQKIEKELDEVRDKAFKTQDPELRKKLNERFDVLWKERSELDRFDTKYNKYIRQYYSDKELSELDINKKNFDTLALQRELSNRGYKLPKSTKEDGTFDGVWGDEIKNALLDYQKKNQSIKKPLSDNQKKNHSRRYPLLDNQPIINPLTGKPIKNKTK